MKRPLSSVVLDGGVAEKIESDVKAFLDRKQWYACRGGRHILIGSTGVLADWSIRTGIPYRRGYLLHGPPGSGKTSFIQALAASLGFDIYLVNLSLRGMADDKLTLLLSQAPSRSIILMEDVDSAFNKRVQVSEDGYVVQPLHAVTASQYKPRANAYSLVSPIRYQSSITFSGFLNALDGVTSGEERIVFMTTNHIERLDAALIRPGRVDVIQLLDDASASQARRLFCQFYARQGHDMTTDGDRSEETEVEALGEWLAGIVEEKQRQGLRVAMASLQGHFIQHTKPQDAVQSCEGLFVRR